VLEGARRQLLVDQRDSDVDVVQRPQQLLDLLDGLDQAGSALAQLLFE